jgi:myosin heavy chain 9/10/11/14
VQQRAAQAEVENQKRQIQELNQSKRQLLAEVADLKDHLELEQKGKSEEAGVLRCLMLSLRALTTPFYLAARRRLQAQLQELEISSTASGTMQGGEYLAFFTFSEC